MDCAVEASRASIADSVLAEVQQRFFVAPTVLGEPFFWAGTMPWVQHSFFSGVYWVSRH